MSDVAIRNLQAVIQQAAERARKLKGRDLSEENTKTSFIEPILGALGWDLLDPDEVQKEYRRRKQDNPVDYALKLGGKARLLLEAKALGRSLDDEKCLVQTVTYATMSGVSWCLISNGEEYRIYNANARVAADEKMLCKVSLTQTDPETAARILSLVSRETFEEEELERHWRLHSVDRDVDRLLRELTSKPDRALVSFIQSRLSAYPAKDIEDSLARLVPKWAEPTFALSSRPGPKKKQRRLQDTGARTTMVDLLKAGVLSAPLRLFRKYAGSEFEAVLRPDGLIEFDGKPYDSPSSAGTAAKKKATGIARATNGWSFWRFAGSDGRPRFLLDARDAMTPGSRSGAATGR